MREKIVTLENHAYLLAALLKLLHIITGIDDLIMQDHSSVLYILESVQASEESTLAAAGRTYDSDDLTLMHTQAYVFEDAQIIIFLMQMFNS